jgi:hypothetical protein
LLKNFALDLGLKLAWLQWTDNGTPYFNLTGHLRTQAFLKGATEISADDAGLISDFWQAKHLAALRRLKQHPRLFIRAQ